MHVMITGGTGFLGRRLAKAVLRDGIAGKAVERLSLIDLTVGDGFDDHRVETMAGDISDSSFVAQCMARPVDVLFHLAAVVSSEAEANFDLGMKVNVDASRLLLEACRAAANRPRVVFTSSVAVFGPKAGDAGIAQSIAVDPQSSYGMEKAVGELLLKEYSRRSFVDGIVLRLPTISVRPGAANRAASSFVSGIIREPISGQPSVCPVPLATALWLLSPKRAIAALQTAAALPTKSLDGDRVVNLPGISVTVAEMLDALAELGGPAARQLVHFEPDEAVERIVASWPRSWDDSRARELGFEGDADFREIVQAFIDEDLPVQKMPVI